MNKKELLKKIDKATLFEEQAVPIYAEHLRTAIYWTGIPKESEEKIKGYLRILRDDSIKHANMFQKIKKIITDTESYV